MEANNHRLLVIRFVAVVVLLFVSPTAGAPPVEMTLVESAVATGAVCLDGTQPAYHLDRGFGSGKNNWIVDIEGGGWCHNITSCLARKGNHLGSSDKMAKQIAFTGILGHRGSVNPDFYNWNRVKVRYCDGASFTGDIEEVDEALGLHFRGARVFAAVMEDLLAKGMKKAQNALLSGCSAGGLAAIIHCDNFRALLPATTKVKCLSDAGYFINALDTSGNAHTESYFNEVVTLQGSSKHLPVDCTSKMKPSLCFFPENIIQQVQTPIFLLNAAYDTWQIRNTLAPDDADPAGLWSLCKSNITLCTPSQIERMEGFRQDLLRTLEGSFEKDLGRGLFINSCYAHCQSQLQEYWLWNDSPKLHGTPIAVAVGDWFYDRRPLKMIDCPYPCDSTCHNRVFNTSEISFE